MYLESVGTMLLTPEVLRSWRVEGDVSSAERSSLQVAVMGPRNHGLHPRSVRGHCTDLIEVT